MKVSVFILSYNSPNKLIKTIESCLVQPEINEYLMIENASTDAMDETYAEIEKKVTQKGHAFKLKRERETISFSAGQNWGLDTAKNETVLLLNNDAFFLKENSLHTALTCLEPEEVGLVGFKILNPDGTMNHFGMVFPLYRVGPEHFGRNQDPMAKAYKTPRPCFAVTGACLLVKRNKIRFNEGYWYEFEDADFCLQYIKQGLNIICDAECLIEHAESTSREKKQVKNSPWERKRTAGKALFYRQWRGLSYKLRLKDLRLSLQDPDVRRKLRIRATQIIIYIVILSSLAGSSLFLKK